MYVFETAQYLVQEIADVIVTQSLQGTKRKINQIRMWRENEDLWSAVLMVNVKNSSNQSTKTALNVVRSQQMRRHMQDLSSNDDKELFSSGTIFCSFIQASECREQYNKLMEISGFRKKLTHKTMENLWLRFRLIYFNFSA